MAIKSAAAYVIAARASRTSSNLDQSVLELKATIVSLEIQINEQLHQIETLQQTIDNLQNIYKNKHLLEDKKRAIY